MVSWKEVTKPKPKGGLIQRNDIKNTTMHISLAWRLTKTLTLYGPGLLVVKIPSTTSTVKLWYLGPGGTSLEARKFVIKPLSGWFIRAMR